MRTRHQGPDADVHPGAASIHAEAGLQALARPANRPANGGLVDIGQSPRMLAQRRTIDAIFGNARPGGGGSAKPQHDGYLGPSSSTSPPNTDSSAPPLQRVKIKYQLISPKTSPDRKWVLSDDGVSTGNFNTYELVMIYREVASQVGGGDILKALEVDHKGIGELVQAIASINDGVVLNTFFDFVVLIEAEALETMAPNRALIYINILDQDEFVLGDEYAKMWYLVCINRFRRGDVGGFLRQLSDTDLQWLSDHSLQGFANSELRWVALEIERRQQLKHHEEPPAKSNHQHGDGGGISKPARNTVSPNVSSASQDEVVIDMSRFTEVSDKANKLKAALEWERSQVGEIYKPRDSWYQMLGGFPTIAAIGALIVTLIGSFVGTFANSTTVVGATLAIALLGVVVSAIPPLVKSIKQRKLDEMPASIIELLLNIAGVTLTQLPGTDTAQGKPIRSGADIVPGNTTYDQAAADAAERIGGWSTAVKVIMILAGCLLLALTLAARMRQTYRERQKEEEMKKTLREAKRE